MRKVKQQQHAELASRDAALCTRAAQIWMKQPTWGSNAIAKRLCQDHARMALSPSRVRRIIMAVPEDIGYEVH